MFNEFLVGQCLWHAGHMKPPVSRCFASMWHLIRCLTFELNSHFGHWKVPSVISITILSITASRSKKEEEFIYSKPLWGSIRIQDSARHCYYEPDSSCQTICKVLSAISINFYKAEMSVYFKVNACLRLNFFPQGTSLSSLVSFHEGLF